ncbi:MAG: hypothetical protein ACTHKJ_02790, partial [Candidatus Nitrosocosmicus sp.]
MGRSIPSFRQLLEIEKLNWSSFKKLLPSKKDRQEFDKVFDSVRLYTSYLGNASNPIVVESVMMGAVFHHYKQLLQFNKEDIAIDEDTLKKELESLLETEHERKMLFYRFSKKWHGFIYSLHKEDRLILLKMILEICRYNECVINVINIQDSQSNIDCLFFLLEMTLHQKRLDELNASVKKKDVTLLDFMY